MAMKIRIGTRGSPLALKQAALVAKAITDIEPALEDHISIVPMTTTGDRLTDRSLIEIGGKSLFTKEIEEALLADLVDIAVHSMKDVPTDCPSGLLIPAMLEREDPRDALITRGKIPLCELPQGALLGTSSLRRQVQMLRLCPHLTVVPLRGNVGTRLQKIQEGVVDATLLAYAGLKRLGLLDAIGDTLDAEAFIPAVGQGAIGIQCREGDTLIRTLLSKINHPDTYDCVTTERSFMDALDGSCRLPMGGYATLEGSQMTLRGFVSDADGTNARERRITFERTQGIVQGRSLGLEMK